jgi:CO dehydrogenase/acetyl-CoA synthase gamma subunit (corrinoid Fe-S protein)
MIAADLYIDRIDFLRYLPGTDCRECGELSCTALLKQLKNGTSTPAECPFLNENQIRAFQIALQADQHLPQVPALELPRAAPTGLTGINKASEDTLVLVSGNSEFTQEVLTAMIAFTLSPLWLLFVDCRGDTVDMSLIYQSLTVEKIVTTLEATPLHPGRVGREMVIPGFASRLEKSLAKHTGWQVRVGPVCIAELTLFLGDKWEVPDPINLS